MAAGTNMPPQFVKYWTVGPGAASIRWGTDGDFDRCRRAINGKITEHGRTALPDNEISGACSTLHLIATGARPGRAAGEHH